MAIITPEALQSDAVLPQCLDNQFVSEAVLHKMLGSAPGEQLLYSDDAIVKARTSDTHAEFLRSLLYSSQVVINRAFFKSHYLREQEMNHTQALAGLINQRAVVPYLHDSSSLEDPHDFATAYKGVPEELLDEIDPEASAYLRFALDEDKNSIKLKELGTMFGSFFTGTIAQNLYESDVIRPMASQLFAPGAGAAHAEVPEQVLSRFTALLERLSDYAYGTSHTLSKGGKRLGREHLYQAFFIQDGLAKPENTPLGLFSQELRTDPALRMLKKLVDLKYNSSLPDMLRRYTLTPASLPGRSALPFEQPANGGTDTNRLVEKIAEFRRAVMGRTPTVVLPRLRRLHLEDILSIREMPEWESFKTSQQFLLTSEPASLLDRFDTYQEQLTKFQQKLERWTLDHGPQARLAHRVCETALHLVVQMGTISVQAQLSQNSDALEGTVMSTLAGELAKTIPQFCNQFCVKLVVGVYDQASMVLDPDHSYQLELARGGRIAQKELLDMIKEIQQSSEIALATSGELAEQASQ